jgi:hypothetical protein
VHNLDELVFAAQELPRESFARRYAGWYLFRRPAVELGSEGVSGLPYDTVQGGILSFREPVDPGLRAAPYRLARLEKRPGNPHPDRLSIGRAVHCDVALRYSFVSKLHAHLQRESDGTLKIGDHRSTNGTSVNGVRLAPGETRTIRTGDRIGFGKLICELLDAPALHAVLRGERASRG